jgi:hypothetical protein
MLSKIAKMVLILIREMKYNQTVETGHVLLKLAMILQEVNDVLDSVNAEDSKRPTRVPIETVISELTLRYDNQTPSPSSTRPAKNVV